MIHRMRFVTTFALTFAPLALAACDGGELATAHIRAVLTGDSTPADGADARDGEADDGVKEAALAPEGEATGKAAADEDGGGVVTPVVRLPNGDTLHIRPSVAAFYRDRQYRPAWTDGDEIRPEGMTLLEAIGRANREGLDRERYHYGTAHRMARLLEDDEVEDRELEYLGNLDLLLTENFARLARDLVAGTLDPEKAGLEWRIERGEVDDRALIEAVVAGEDPVAILDSLRPRVPYYDRMVRGFRRLQTVQRRGGWGEVPAGEALSEGDEGPRVEALRRRLMAGDDEREARLARVSAGAPARFDADLRKALEHFQTRHTLHEDGSLGPNTLAALNIPVEERIDQLRLNLDRWRWLPNDLGDSFLLVNVAGFELEVVEHDSVIEAMDVVVGKTANRTPIFQDTLEYIVVNPYWNVPETIAEEEIFPELALDPMYLERHNYEMVHEDGHTRIRQRPGAGNALGHVKFLFPNDMNIYLHDTPADHLFSQKTRAFSHGCIRVERPDELAEVLLTTLTDLDASDYERLRASGEESWIPVDRKIPVYILYFTSWVDEDGTIRFHPDIYSRDRSLEGEREEKLGPVEARPIANAT